MSRLHANFMRLVLLVPLFLVGLPGAALAHPQLGGHWVFNFKLSDDSDKQVEKAIKAGGGRLPHTRKKGWGRYRGGPSDQQLYDHLTYDLVLNIKDNEPEFHFSYEDGFKRVFFSDDRKQEVSASSLQSGVRKVFSFGYWVGDKLVVESRPLDGGHIMETYSLDPDGRLRVELNLKPLTFLAPIHIVRVYDRAPDKQKPESEMGNGKGETGNRK